MKNVKLISKYYTPEKKYNIHNSTLFFLNIFAVSAGYNITMDRHRLICNPMCNVRVIVFPNDRLYTLPENCFIFALITTIFVR